MLDLIADRMADRVADRVIAGLLASVDAPAEASRPATLVDAATVARALGVSRQWVYEHRAELGAQRLGAGERPRLRFDLERARAVFTCSQGRRSEAADRLSEADPPPAPTAARRRVPKRVAEPGSVLAIRPQKGGARAA